MKQIKSLLVYTAALVFLMSSCSKYDGYFDYENTEKVFQGTSISYLESKKGTFDSLLVALNRLPELKQALNDQELTLFAPTNASFQIAINNLNLVRSNQGKSKLYIQNLNLVELDTLMTKYMVKGIVPTDSMNRIDGLFVETFKISHPMHAQRIKEDASGFVSGGMELVYYSDTKDNNFISQWNRTASQAVNIYTTTGIVHVLGSKHEFGFGDFLTRMNK
ncbi:hypothetical protein ACP6L2_12975 [Sphingobacterium lactis]|uniref:hypothetical protein n=1 Tax=Sphingobacterium lactis TaxID=797291 RepID=UPI003F802C62